MDSNLEREGNESNMDVESPGPSVPPDENKSGWKSTASATAKLLFHGVRDSADAPGPIKSIAESLYLLLKNCEARLPLHIPCSMLIGPTAPKGGQVGDRIVGAPDRCACRAALQARP